MKRITYTLTAALAAALLVAALSKCGVPHTATATAVAPPLRTAGNVTADSCEVTAGWQNASATLRFTVPGHIGEIVLVQGENTLRRRAHCYSEAPGVWLAEWAENHFRIFANGHAEGEIDGQIVYFIPLGSGQCFPE